MYSSNNIQPTAYLCQQLGFDEQARRQRITMMDLGDADMAILQQLRLQVIEPSGNQIMDQFYSYLLGFDALRPFLGSEENIRRLKMTQLEYLKQFGLDFQLIDYFEYRLRVGIAHERIGLPLYMYLSATRCLQKLIIDAIPDELRQQASLFATFCQTINKIMMLDCSLAIDAYNRTHVEIMSHSIEALEQERDILHSELMHDTLTGVFSRRYILDSLNKQLAQLSRLPERSISIAMLDLDHFKRVNDVHGHLVGDKLLHEFCRVVSKLLREQDYFGRFGGEEFLLILTETSAHEAKSVLNRIREAIELQVFTYEGESIPLTVSIGCAAAQAGDKVDDLIERADSALYQAKESGRNQVCCLD